MKTLIVYSSRTGNTKKLAEGIYNNLSLSNMDIKPLHEVGSVEGYETILVGYWVDKGGPNEEAESFMKELKGKKVGIFATLGAYPDSQHAWDSLLNGENLVKEYNVVIGKYICQGKIDSELIERFKNLPSNHHHSLNEERLERYKKAEKHPNEIDILSAVNLFQDRLS